MAQFIAYSIGVFLLVIILLVIILLVAKKYLSPSGNVNITVNGDKVLNVPQGNNLMATLNENGIFLPSACGGKASCGQCKVQVLEGGGEILDSEKPHFTRKQPLAPRLSVQGEGRPEDSCRRVYPGCQGV